MHNGSLRNASEPGGNFRWWNVSCANGDRQNSSCIFRCRGIKRTVRFIRKSLGALFVNLTSYDFRGDLSNNEENSHEVSSAAWDRYSWCCIFCCYFLLTYPPICSSFTWCSDFEFDINFNFPSISYSESRGSVFLRVMLNASAQPSTNSQVYRFSNARSCIQCPPGATWSKCGCGCLQRFKLEFQVGF